MTTAKLDHERQTIQTDRHLVAGRYRLHEQIGHGRLGEIYEAVDERYNESLAGFPAGGCFCDRNSARYTQHCTLAWGRVVASTPPPVYTLLLVCGVHGRPKDIMGLITELRRHDDESDEPKASRESGHPRHVLL